MRTLLLTLLLAACATVAVDAQKIGYVNSQEILAEMADVKAAESDIVAYRDQQQKLLETKMQAAQAEYQTLAEKQQAGELTPKQLQEGEASLQRKQQELQQLEASIQEQLVKRREEKFQPIFDRINTIIEQVAQEGGYSYVFDATAAGVIVYADEGMNLTAEVKSKLAAN